MRGIELEVEGITYAGWVSASVQIRMDSISRVFGFEATSKDGFPLPFTTGEVCKVKVDGELVVTGTIEVVNVDGDAESHFIAVQGRDFTSDILDSQIGEMSDIRPSSSTTLKSVCERIISHIGSDLEVDDQVGPPPFNKAEDLFAPEAGIGSFEFLEQLFRKRQVLMGSTVEGQLAIIRSSGKRIDAEIRHKANDDENNVLAYSVSYDRTGRFHRYKAISQMNATAALTWVDQNKPKLVYQVGTSLDDDPIVGIRAGRQMVIVSESLASEGEAKKRAEWQRNISTARGNVYSATVHGYRHQAGDLWSVNTLPHVIDDFAGLDAWMLIDSVTYVESLEVGHQTTLGLVAGDTYTLEAATPDDAAPNRETEKTNFEFS